MTDRDDLLKELGTALKVEPSSQFANGVRSRVQKSQARTTQMWWGLAAAAAIGLAVMTLSRPSHEVAPQIATTNPVQAAVPAPAPTAGVAKPTPAPAVGGRVFRPGTSPIAGPAVVRAAASETSEPRLEVITNQGALLREMWSVVGARLPLIEMEATDATGQEAATGVVVNPLVVPPIVVNEIGKEPAGGGNPIIRRANATRETK